jgi:hypothetical protein
MQRKKSLVLESVPFQRSLKQSGQINDHREPPLFFPPKSGAENRDASGAGCIWFFQSMIPQLGGSTGDM